MPTAAGTSQAGRDGRRIREELGGSWPPGCIRADDRRGVDLHDDHAWALGTESSPSPAPFRPNAFPHAAQPGAAAGGIEDQSGSWSSVCRGVGQIERPLSPIVFPSMRTRLLELEEI